MAIPQHIVAILQKHLEHQPLTEEEVQQLRQWHASGNADAEILSGEDWQHILRYTTFRLDTVRQDAFLRRVMAAAQLKDQAIPADELASDIQLPVRRIHFIRRWGWAAAIIILFGAGAYLYRINTKQTEKPLAVIQPIHEISPGSNKAILTLSNGKKIELSNTTSETISDGSSSIANHAGQLNYLNSSRVSNPLRGGASERSEEGVGVTPSATNTMTTPRGGQYTLTLSDGTKIWLNAASSITYPIAFTGKTRTVSITGEAYFEVAANKEKPFIVKTATSSPFEKGGNDDAPNKTPHGGFSILVLGTSFNINSYPDEPSIKASLAEGSIKINSTILKPGQAYVNNKVINTNIQQDLAWKNGGFNFNDADLKSVFRQLSRWYNVSIQYEGKLPDKNIWGEMGRNLNLSQVLMALQKVGIHTRLEGNTLIVLSE